MWKIASHVGRRTSERVTASVYNNELATSRPICISLSASASLCAGALHSASAVLCACLFGAAKLMAPARRRAPDGNYYFKWEFFEFFGEPYASLLWQRAKEKKESERPFNQLNDAFNRFMELVEKQSEASKMELGDSGICGPGAWPPAESCNGRKDLHNTRRRLVNGVRAPPGLSLDDDSDKRGKLSSSPSVASSLVSAIESPPGLDDLGKEAAAGWHYEFAKRRRARGGRHGSGGKRWLLGV